MKTWTFFPGVRQDTNGSGGDIYFPYERSGYTHTDGNGRDERTDAAGWLNGDGRGKGYGYAPVLREVIP